MMMASYMNSSSNSSESISTDLDKDRYYNCTLNGPEYVEYSAENPDPEKLKQLPRIKITFSAPKSAEQNK
jgi:hypothetical protein